MVTHRFTNHTLGHPCDINNDFKIIKQKFFLVGKSLKKAELLYVVLIDDNSLEITYVKVLKNEGEVNQLCSEDDNG